MGKCKHCGEKAGFLSKKHKECEQKFQTGQEVIISSVAEGIVSGGDLGFLENKIKTTSKDSYIKEETKVNLVIQGFDKAIEKIFEDGVLSEDEEVLVSKFSGHFNLSNEELDQNGSHNKLVQGSVLRDVMNGIIPDKIQISGTLPFNLMKSEKLVWVFTNVELLEETIKTHFEGGSQGVSVKVTKGVYYRTSSFKGHPVKTAQMVNKGPGILGITTKHIYFSGQNSFRTRLDKIVQLKPYEDGIGVQKEGVSSKPQIFKNFDGWFCFNLVKNLSQL